MKRLLWAPIVALCLVGGCTGNVAAPPNTAAVDIGGNIRVYVDESGYRGYRVYDPRAGFFGGYRYGGAGELPVNVLNAGRPCETVYKPSPWHGRYSYKMATRCYDRFGRGFIVKGSERIVQGPAW